ncbi:hypothetical protein [Hyphococcus sp.]|jgi:hypothetical protein|uniref:hypothetical protein n=1 Tax=Hyphococcus sp. TaxID=2038636 RepID=UPI003D102D9D
MRSLTHLRFFIASAAAMLLGGCLVSDLPVLDSKTGKARPISEGDYLACPLENGEIADGAECDRFHVERTANGEYVFVEGGDSEPARLRFRKVARDGYAVQSAESDSFVYYYGKTRSGGLLLVMMNCPELPSDLRARLISRGDLETDDEDFEVCKVKTLRGLVEAAQAYHRGDASQMKDAAILITPAPPLAEME